MIGFIVPGVFNFIVGGGRHIWDIRLKDFFRLLYVRDTGSDSCVMDL